MKTILKVLGSLVALVVGLFVLTFTIYFFNLDMKLTAALEPFFIKHYDNLERDSHL